MPDSAHEDHLVADQSLVVSFSAQQSIRAARVPRQDVLWSGALVLASPARPAPRALVCPVWVLHLYVHLWTPGWRT